LNIFKTIFFTDNYKLVYSFNSFKKKEKRSNNYLFIKSYSIAQIEYKNIFSSLAWTFPDGVNNPHKFVCSDLNNFCILNITYQYQFKQC